MFYVSDMGWYGYGIPLSFSSSPKGMQGHLDAASYNMQGLYYTVQRGLRGSIELHAEKHLAAKKVDRAKAEPFRVLLAVSSKDSHPVSLKRLL